MATGLGLRGGAVAVAGRADAVTAHTSATATAAAAADAGSGARASAAAGGEAGRPDDDSEKGGARKAEGAGAAADEEDEGPAEKEVPAVAGDEEGEEEGGMSSVSALGAEEEGAGGLGRRAFMLTMTCAEWRKSSRARGRRCWELRVWGRAELFQNSHQGSATVNVVGSRVRSGCAMSLQMTSPEPNSRTK